ncbi:uncharacterized protein LOC114530791 [Dendronephthya gigantea]|uniref:uncharacterized protein LOC114530791 n=1 Tax=Dendronephthya gigantea TaxID=151771 RepID=UPI001069441D|nr:uncharacterized protein LOC114530791 [Dendronephthya gigantea]
MSDEHSESSGNVSEASLSTEESSNGEDFGVVYLHPDGNAPFQDEPLAIVGQEYKLNFEEDKDGIPAQTLEAKYTKLIPVNDWCMCSLCRDELLVGALEYRCCREVLCAIGKAVFDGSIKQISCITQHKDYEAMVNAAVLTMVGPLLYLRAVAYRWLVRWFYGYLGCDNRRPLPACIYHHIMKKFPNG